MLDHIIETVFKDGWATYSTKLQAVLIYEKDNYSDVANALVIQEGSLDRDFEDFVKQQVLEKERDVHAQALFAKQVNIENNTYQNKHGKWIHLTKLLYRAKPTTTDIVLEHLETNQMNNSKLSIKVYGDPNSTSIKNNVPIYASGEINRKVEKANGTMPKAHVVHVEYPNKMGYGYGVGIRVCCPSGLFMKSMIEMPGTEVYANRRACVLYHPNFVWIEGHTNMIRWRGESVIEHLSVEFDCGKARTKRDPLITSWMTEEDAINELVSSKAVWNPIKQPGPDVSLAQMCNYWAGKRAEKGVEALKWAGYMDDHILQIIERNRENAEKAFISKFIYEAFNELGQKIYASTNSHYINGHRKDLDEIMAYMDAFHNKGVHFDSQFVSAIQDADNYINNTQHQQRSAFHGVYKNT